MSVWEGLSPPYSTIVADPPWPYGAIGAPTQSRPKGTLAMPYSTLDLDGIAALPVADLAADTRLFMWVTNRYLRHAWDVIESWGFDPGGRVFVWTKKPRCTTNVTTEYLLTGKRGKPPRMPWSGTTWFDWPLQSVHSQKPAAALDLIESWSPGPYVELFARAPRLGWDSWGHGYESERAS